MREDMCEKTAKERAEREDCEKRSWATAAVCVRAPKKLAHVRGAGGGVKVAKS